MVLTGGMDAFEEIQGRGVAGRMAAGQVETAHGGADMRVPDWALEAEFAHDKFLRLRVDLSHNMGAILGNSTLRTRVERRA